MVVKAIKRLGRRFAEAANKNGNMKLYQEDIDALETIADYIERTRNDMVGPENAYFKLFVHVYGKLLAHYDTDVYSEIPQKHICGILEKPITQLVSELAEQMNEKVISDALDTLDPPQQHHFHPDHIRDAYLSEGHTPEWIDTKLNERRAEKDLYMERVRYMMENGSDAFDIVFKGEKVWEEDDVYQSVHAMAATAFERFNR